MKKIIKTAHVAVVISSLMTISVQAQRSFMQDMLTTPTEFKLINQRNINSTELEFSPALYGNQVVYIGNGRKDAGTQKSTSNYYNIYATQFLIVNIGFFCLFIRLFFDVCNLFTLTL